MTISTPKLDLGHATALLLGTKAVLAHASYGVIWRFESTSDRESEWTATSQPPSPDPIIGGVAAATPALPPIQRLLRSTRCEVTGFPKDAGD